ncbi:MULTISPECIES: ImmA/IrrE family metallo-endopeptidase [Mesorhizobium]|uniref:ImmA/IrrE family metallo-endopeptidase n=2 Tax=Mesorhizobium TaxID=68287 RepID=A0AB38TIX6_9HYPH|nr:MULTISPECIES: ImmA/IrrE family metallo-endopeptidase [Mesorhizobium]MDF3217904.1 ImmA/IrrE family metallo-endopeptidase [Mesorhizobium ciceri]UTU54843.1 ImmA/IrrE family metallo-endopeptidase [Mesorhizobium ciceri]
MIADVSHARAAARKLLQDFGVAMPPVPIERIIKSRKIVLQYAPLEEDLSGMAYIKDGVSIIGINALHHPNRQRFSAAHELAHHVLHDQEIRQAVHVDKGIRVLFRDDVASLGTEPMEIEANAFASELLIPGPLLAAAVEGGGIDLEDEAAIEALARRFRVSPAAMRFRLSRGE